MAVDGPAKFFCLLNILLSMFYLFGLSLTKPMFFGPNLDVLKKSGSIIVVYAKQGWVEMVFSVDAAGNE